MCAKVLDCIVQLRQINVDTMDVKLFADFEREREDAVSLNHSHCVIMSHRNFLNYWFSLIICLGSTIGTYETVEKQVLSVF